MKFKDKYVVVTGASTGIGRAISVEFGKQGVCVGLVARKLNELEKTKELVEKAGGKADIFKTDLSNVDSVNQLVDQIVSKVDKVSALVNVAGIWHGKDEVYAEKDFESFSQKVILDTYAVGLTAPTLLVHGLVSQLALGGGKIVNISGTFESGAKGWLPYYVSKRAIEDFTIGLSEELKRVGIDVNCISPSDTATEAYNKYFPQYMKDAISPEIIAKQVVHLCSSEADNITGKVWVMEKEKKPYEGYHK